jgi:hypothetical protein
MMLVEVARSAWRGLLGVIFWVMLTLFSLIQLREQEEKTRSILANQAQFSKETNITLRTTHQALVQDYLEDNRERLDQIVSRLEVIEDKLKESEDQK